jgi:iron complex transport system substrate-binding protein
MLIRAANAAAMAVALALAMATTFSAPDAAPEIANASAAPQDVRRVHLPAGGEALLDAGDHPVPLRRYSRIVAGSTVADELLLALCEPSRIAGFTTFSADQAVQRFRFAGVPVHGGLDNVERILALHPDLIVTNNIGNGQAIVRLREHGIAVFDMGPMRGMSTLPGNIRQLAWLLGEPQRGLDYAHAFERRMAAVARGLAPERRKRALYVSVYGDKLYGGTRGTSYHDVLEAAGLIDVAAARYRDWPAYSSEELLVLDPELLVTAEGMGPALCRHAGLERLRACTQQGGIVELAPHLTQSAGPPMLDAAEQLYERVYEAGPGARP